MMFSPVAGERGTACERVGVKGFAWRVNPNMQAKILSTATTYSVQIYLRQLSGYPSPYPNDLETFHRCGDVMPIPHIPNQGIGYRATSNPPFFSAQDVAYDHRG